jgi:hypothetical protein
MFPRSKKLNLIRWAVSLLWLATLGQPVWLAAAAPPEREPQPRFSVRKVEPQAAQCNNRLADSDFEAMLSPWNEFYPDLNPQLRQPAPIAFCEAGTCDVSAAQAPAGPLNGKFWVWLGGGITDTVPIQSITQGVSQTLTLPSGQSASLEFYLWISRADAGTEASDQMQVRLGNTTVFTATALDQFRYGGNYRLVRFDVSPFATGLTTTLTISATTRAQQNTLPPVISFNVDSVRACSPAFYPVYLPIVRK